MKAYSWGSYLYPVGGNKEFLKDLKNEEQTVEGKINLEAKWLEILLGQKLTQNDMTVDSFCFE